MEDLCITNLVTPCIGYCLSFLFKFTPKDFTSRSKPKSFLSFYNSWDGVMLFHLILRWLMGLLCQLRIVNKGMWSTGWMIIDREAWKYSVRNLSHCDFYYCKARPKKCYIFLWWSNLKFVCILSVILFSNFNFESFFSLCCMLRVVCR
jgi:hypothetical protein